MSLSVLSSILFTIETHLFIFILFLKFLLYIMWVYFSQPAENFDCDISNNLSFFRDFGDVAKKKKKIKKCGHVHFVSCARTHYQQHGAVHKCSAVPCVCERLTVCLV